MRRSSKLISLLLVVCMVFALTVTAFAAEATGDVVVLYTNDVHCGVDGNIGYAGLAAYKAEMEAAGNQVVLVDAGDAIQGEAIGTLSKGAYLMDIMNQVGYDFMIPGNHEFDFGMDNFLELAKESKGGYYCCNFVDANGDPVFDAYKVMTFGDLKVAFVGIATPETFTKSTPTYFQDGKGNFIYGFCEGNNGQDLYDAVQKAVDEAAKEADVVIAVGHLGMEGATTEWRSDVVIANTTGIDAFIDAHSHETIPSMLVQNKDGVEIPLTSSGTKLKNIGKVTISADGSVKTELVSKYEAKDETTDTYVKGIQAKLDSILQTVVAKSDVVLTINGADGNRAVRKAETNLGDLCADAYRAVLGADVAFVNGGGIRANIEAGDVTYENIINVHPFNNEACLVEATGQEILDALELGARNCPEENGGFQQVSGLTYEIHTYIPSSVKLDEKNMFVGVEGEYRVKNVMIGGEPLDLNKTYTLASHNYMIKNGGDGFTMFMDNKLLKDCIMLDNQVLISYIQNTLGGKIPSAYANAQGRIKVLKTPFTDVGDVWYTEAVSYVNANGIMNGTSATTFSPEKEMTRGMLVTMLYRLAGSPAVEGKVSEVFTDCKDGEWYSEAVLWASQNKIVDGLGDGKFAPTGKLTREAMAKILYTYALYNGADPITAFAVTYKDADAISGWAMAGVAYCTNAGILSGTGENNFSPRGSATRAMGAKVMMTLDLAAKEAA